MVDEIVFTDSFKKFVKKKVDIVVDEGDIQYVALYNNWLINEGYISYIGYIGTMAVKDDNNNIIKGFYLWNGDSYSRNREMLNHRDIKMKFDRESFVCSILFGKNTIFDTMRKQCIYEYERGLMSCKLYPLKVK